MGVFNVRKLTTTSVVLWHTPTAVMKLHLLPDFPRTRLASAIFNLSDASPDRSSFMELSRFRKHASMADSRRAVLSILGETITAPAPAPPAPRPPLEPAKAPVDALLESPVSKVPARCLSGKGSRAFSKRPRSSLLPLTGVAIHLLLLFCRGRGDGSETPLTPSRSIFFGPIPGGGRECDTLCGGGCIGRRGRWGATSCIPFATGLVRGAATWDGSCFCLRRQGFSLRSSVASSAKFFLA